MGWWNFQSGTGTYLTAHVKNYSMVYANEGDSDQPVHRVIGSDLSFCVTTYSVELQWLEHLWNHENMFETGVIRANEC